MQIPIKKLKNGMSMPEFGVGTWHMGGDWFQWDESYDDTKDIQAIKKAIDLGVTHFDSAEGYGGGQSEHILGKGISGYDRSRLCIVTKVSGSPKARKRETGSGENFSYDGIMSSCKNSLKNLNTDYIDIYLLHWFSDEVPLTETMAAMDDLIKQGLIKSVGVSNFGVKRLKEAQEASKNPIVCNQVHYNLSFREPEVSGLLEYCQKNDVLLSAWRPVEKGLLTGGNFEIVNNLAEKYNKTPAQIAINWLVSQQNVVTLSKTSTIAHLEENLGAIGWYMESEDIELLRTEFPEQHEYSDAVNLSD